MDLHEFKRKFEKDWNEVWDREVRAGKPTKEHDHIRQGMFQFVCTRFNDLNAMASNKHELPTFDEFFKNEYMPARRKEFNLSSPPLPTTYHGVKFAWEWVVDHFSS